jgi:hypothetical protein
MQHNCDRITLQFRTISSYLIGLRTLRRNCAELRRKTGIARNYVATMNQTVTWVKTDWSNIISNHLKAGNKSIKNADFPRLMKRLFVEKQAFSTTRIVSSFARSGKRSTLRTEILKREFRFASIYIPRNRVDLRDEEPPTRDALRRTVTLRSTH